MSPEEIRLECLRIAAGVGAPDPIDMAARMAAFVAGKGNSDAEKKLELVRAAVS